MDVVSYGVKLMSINSLQEQKKYFKIFIYIIAFVIVIFPFANLLHMLYPFNILGKSAWVVLPVVIISLFYVYIVIGKKLLVSIPDIVFIALVVLSWLILEVREIAHDELNSYLDMRYIATSLLFLLLMQHLPKDAFVLIVVAYAVVIQGLLVAATRFINYYFFPSLMVTTGVDGIAFLNTNGELTRDLLLASSMSGNHIVCGMFVLLALKKYKVLKSSISFVIFQLFMMISVFNTISRFPIAIVIAIFLFSLFYIKLRFLLMIAVASLIVYIANNDAGIYIPDFVYRFSEGSGDRLDKFLVSMELIQSSPLNVLIGPSLVEVESAYTHDGNVISDNSYGLIALAFGLPFTLAYFTFLLTICFKNRSDVLSLLFLAYILINLGLTNSILWEPWIFSAFSGFVIVSYFGKVPTSSRNSIRLNGKIYV